MVRGAPMRSAPRLFARDKLDTVGKQSSIGRMKASVTFLLTLLLSGARLWAQPHVLEASGTEKDPAAASSERHLMESVVSDNQGQSGSEVVVKKHFRVSGPLVQPFKEKGIIGFPRRLLHLINPFAKAEPRSESENARELSPRAWTTVAGWNPGGSAFPDPVTHESSMGLISVHR